MRIPRAVVGPQANGRRKKKDAMNQLAARKRNTWANTRKNGKVEEARRGGWVLRLPSFSTSRPSI